MEKQINFLGVSLTPYSDISPDGQLSACSNLERHAGSLRPVSLHGNPFTLPEQASGFRLITVHNTANFNHFIFHDPDSGTLSWSNQDSTLALAGFGTLPSEVRSVDSIGNTVIVLSDDGLHYYLWKDTDYEYLGRQLPHIPLVWGLRGSVNSFEETIKLTGDYSFLDIPGAFVGLNEEDKNQINSRLRTKLLERLADARNNNYFVYPFFARFGYTTIFGDCCFSPPVLMLPNSGGMVDASLSSYKTMEENRFVVSFHQAALDYTIPGFEEVMAGLQKWNDVITGMAIYVSEPLSGMMEEDEWTTLIKTGGLVWYPVRGAGVGILDLGTGRYQRHRLAPDGYNYGIYMPRISDEDYYNKFRETSVFRKVAFIKLDDLEERAVVRMNPGTLPNLGTLEHIQSEPLNEHDMLIPRYSFVYNQRLNLANITRRLYGFRAETLFTREDGPSSAAAYNYNFYVCCKDGGGNQVVKCPGGLTATTATSLSYFYYPNPSACKMLVEREAVGTGEKKYIEVPLKEHPGLNGAFFFNNLEFPDWADTGTPPEGQPLVCTPNTIYTSEVANPFHFPASGINVVGIGEIVGLSSITTALSQGQFGQFPLMVFCTDGNYAIQVNSEGLFSGISPMQRDVCVNADSITQIDGAVVFVSARGVMTADGSRIDCVSECLNGVQDDLSFIDRQPSFLASSRSVLSPVDFFRRCVVAYDYAGKRILFFSRDEDAAWVLSLEDTSWSQARLGRIRSIVNVYPYSFLQFADSPDILRLDRAYSFTAGESHAGMLITRPLKLDSLQYKSIRQLALEGNFSRPQLISLYASNDGRHWFKLGKSTARRVLTPGRAFKYYRVVIETGLSEAENISGLRIDYAVRPERRFR